MNDKNTIQYKKSWLRLDNAAKIYPAIISSRMTSVFRISATMRNIISTAFLQQALETTICRYPYFRVKLRSGIFWHYLQENTAVPIAEIESKYPCRKIDRNANNKFLFRVLVHHKRISVEFSHILTDGTGALHFLKTLITHYLALSETLSTSLSNTFSWDTITTDSNKEEQEDAYLRYYKKNIPPPANIPPAFHLPGPLIPSNSYKITTGIVDIAALKMICQERKVTITEFLLAIYLEALQYVSSNTTKQKPIRIMVPVNLRTIYPSKTMRNFFLTVLPGIDPRLGHFQFDEILKTVYHFMRVEINDKYINQQISRNISNEKNFLIRFIPLALKILFEKVIYRKFATSNHSGLLTNLNLVSFPEQLAEHIERLDFIPNPNPVTKITAGMIGFNKKLHISFGSLVEYTSVEKHFFSSLAKMGIDVTVETNI